MTRQRATILSLVLAVLAASAAIAVVVSGTARGFTTALYDQLRGRPTLYALGCMSGPPIDPLEFRYQELLAQRHSLSFVTIGGIGPTQFQADFVLANNTTTYRLLAVQHGRDFIDRARKDAERDVVTRRVVLRGCYNASTLQMRLATPPQKLIEVLPVDPLDSGGEDVAMPVTIVGRVTEVRAGGWNAWQGGRIHAERITPDPTLTCADEQS